MKIKNFLFYNDKKAALGAGADPRGGEGGARPPPKKKHS